MAQIIPIRDLKDTSAISERCKKSDEPIFVTKNGYGDMVLMSMDLYNRTFAELQLYKALKEAEDELDKGAPTVSADTFVAERKAKYARLLR